MQTTQTRPARRTKEKQVMLPSGAGGIRHGFLGCRTGIEGLARMPGLSAHAALSRHVATLAAKVNNTLRTSAQLVISHPTPATLGEAFNATDTVAAACRSVHRKVGKAGSARMQARMERFLLGVQTGITQLESGLESIPLLPPSAPDYPEDEE